MSELALQLIAENKKTKATSLDLGNCGLTKLPDELFECVWLEELILSSEWNMWNAEKKVWRNFRSQNEDEENVLSELNTRFAGFSKLKKLFAGGRNKKWRIKNLEPLKNLSSLTTLYVSSNQVTSLEPLKNLLSLTTLYVSSNQVISLEPLKNLTNLTSLVAHSNQITSLEPLKNLSSLTSLVVYSNQVTSLEPLINLSSLVSLNVMYNRVANLEPLKNLLSLTTIYVSSNQVTSLEPLKNLTNLASLYVNSNQITSLEPILPQIEKDLAIEWEYFKDNPWQHPPAEIIQQGNEAIRNYFAQIEAQGGTEEILEAKMIIVGEGGTGKTTLFEKMKNPAFDPLVHRTDETHGINIHEGLEIRHKSLGEQVLRVNLWDFGGQALLYMTHQFFLTPHALYVLMMDARAEAPNLPYWFKIISLLGKEREDSPEKVPLLLVFNKRKDGTGKLPQYQDILQYYEEHLDPLFLEVDFAENDYRFENLIKTIEERLVNLPIVRSKLPRQWKPIREVLSEESKNRPYIPIERFEEICSECQVTKEDDQLHLSGYLHQLGSLLHFQNDKSLRDLVILSPQWVVEGVYCFLKNEKIAKQGGRFTPDDFFEVLKNEGYKRADAQKILKLMTKNNFDICYESSEGNYMAAQLLPDNAPRYIWHKKSGALQFRYQYPIMPKGLMSRLIVRLSDFIERDEAGVEMVWKKGAILRFKIEGEECRVLMREDDAESQSGLRQIILEVLGEPQYRKYALRRVRDEVDELHRRWFRSIHADEMVPCCCGSFCKNAERPYLHKLDKLLNLKFNRNKPTVTCGESGEDVLIQLMLEGVYEKSEIAGFRKEGQQQEDDSGKETPPITPLPRFHSPAPKYLLALEGGGMNCLAQLAILEELESRIQRQTGNSVYVLSDTFDLIGGSGLAEFVATDIALGKPIAVIRQSFLEIFGFMYSDSNSDLTKRTLHGQYPELMFDSSITSSSNLNERQVLSNLRVILQKHFGNGDMTNFAWKAGICFSVRTSDNGEIMPIVNHPEVYYYQDFGKTALYQLVLSTNNPFYRAAFKLDMPTPFSALEAGAGLFHNPELLLFHIATHLQFPLKWPKGEDKLHLVSIGTGPIPKDAFPQEEQPELESFRMSPRNEGNYAPRQAQTQQERLARWLLEGEPLTLVAHTPSQPRFPLGFRPAKVTRLSLGELSPGDFARYDTLRTRAARVLESIDISIFMPAVSV